MSFKRHLIIVSGLAILVLCLNSCKNPDKTESDTSQQEEVAVTTPVPSFSADSAYFYTQKQVNFGPRVPGTAAHQKTGEWIASQMEAFGYKVVRQGFTALLYDGKTMPGVNFIASYKPEATKRIALAAHWDTRPFSDRDEKVKNKAIEGANDGASGVGVLLEIARNLSLDSATVGVDFLFFDIEDWGAPSDFKGNMTHPYGGYCLGSEYWSKNPHIQGYSAFYGILLDMVGAKGAQFRHEGVSMQVAPSVVSTVWSTASQLGFGQFFINADGGSITDDHVPVIQNLKFPMIDIIDYRANGDFFPYHHTLGDNMTQIDPLTLKAVGQTVMHVIYQEK